MAKAKKGGAGRVRNKTPEELKEEAFRKKSEEAKKAREAASGVSSRPPSAGEFSTGVKGVDGE